MGIYYILTQDGDVFELDATTSMVLSETGRLTSYTVEDGATLSDHYVNENSKFSFSGVITDLKTRGGSVAEKSTDEFIGGILKMKNSSTPFTLYWRDSGVQSGIFRKDCMIERITFSQSGNIGTISGLHAYEVSIEISQIRKGQAATLTREAIPSIKDSSTKKKESNATTTTATTDSTSSAVGKYTRETAIDVSKASK